jgi:replicative DNA helicase
LVAGVPTAANASYYAEIVRERAILRRLVTAGTRIVQWGHAGEGDVDQVVDRAQSEIFEVTSTRTSEDYLPLADIMDDAVTEIEGIASRSGEMVGVPTGFIDLDRLTNGLHPGQLVILAARPAIGKALALDTPLPTPAGWTTMGEVQVGDQVVGADGQHVAVVAATEVMIGRDCYLVEFSDGSSVVADANHQWTTDCGEVRSVSTTQELSLLAKDSNRLQAHTLPLVKALVGDSVDLPVGPYSLGVRLAEACCRIGEAEPDYQEISMMVEGEGYDRHDLAGVVQRAGVVGSPHIPRAYLRAPVADRRALLAGLLDYSGAVTEDGTVLITSLSRRLAQELFELLASLGISPLVSGESSRRIGDPAGVTLSFETDEQVFRVHSKDFAHKELRGDSSQPARHITAISNVPSVPVRCIEVDSGDHLFLAGRSMIPTHNSTLGLDLARSASLKHGLTSVIFSLEMSRNEIVMRLLSAEAQIPLQNMRSGKMNDPEWRKIAARQGALHEAPLFVDDSPNMTMTEIRAKCRRLKQRHDLRLVVVDYMQLMQSGKKVESRQQEVSEFSRSMKLLAKELEVPVVAISQLNRGAERRDDKKPMLSDLRESGSLEQDADVVLLIHREDAYDKESSRVGEADFIVAKHRNGPTDTITVSFQGHYSRFVDMARE